MATTVRTKSKKSKTPVVKTTHVAFALDSSGSMGSIRRATVEAFNRNLADLKKAASPTNDVRFTLVVFGDPDISTPIVGVPVGEVEPMGITDFRPNGMTPLLAAVRESITRISVAKPSKDEAFLVVVLTDGGDNDSTRFGCTAQDIALRVKDLLKTDQWTFGFQVPRGYSQAVVNLGIPRGCVTEWDQSDEGVASASVANAAAISHYFGARDMGLNSVGAFYTDTSRITKTAIRKTLDDVTKKVVVHEITRRSSIQAFVESKHGRYTPGNGYYQLTKPETVQSYKNLLLQDRQTLKVYGGDEVRTLVQLPPASAGTNGRVRPGDHSKYDVFVQSTSTNRILNPGSKLAYFE